MTTSSKCPKTLVVVLCLIGYAVLNYLFMMIYHRVFGTVGGNL